MDEEEQEEESGQTRVQEILSALPQACSFSGEKVRPFRPVAPIGRAAVSKTACCRFESCQACVLKNGQGKGFSKGRVSEDGKFYTADEGRAREGYVAELE